MTQAALRSDDDVRLKEVTVTLSQQQIIEVAYQVMEHLDPLIKHNVRPFMDAVTGYRRVYYTMRELLSQLDQDYVQEHSRISEFFRDGRELDNSFDRLRWIEKYESSDDPFK